MTIADATGDKGMILDEDAVVKFVLEVEEITANNAAIDGGVVNGGLVDKKPDFEVEVYLSGFVVDYPGTMEDEVAFSPYLRDIRKEDESGEAGLTLGPGVAQDSTGRVSHSERPALLVVLW
ncbi:hypothetical protein NDU88_005000 [Pleurodeles waltl]|uniref:Uncharacterized protein n=1 Tax=Pleurodeles waltl TaxID=8319 RepID=A0AAV7LK92_PLEWA|nr:hypothetical protein NDU88_005000 [Pleurodeles waltl]